MTRTRNGLWIGLLLALGCQASKGQDLTAEQLTTVIAARQAELQPCYQAALDKSPDSREFRIQATLHVDKGGSVEDVDLEKTMLPSVAPCVEKVVRTWKFPQAKADTYATMPIIFQPKIEPIFEAPRNPFGEEQPPKQQ